MSVLSSLIIPSEAGCYLGITISLFIAFKLIKMKELSFLNKMFLIFYVVDSVFGLLEVYFLFSMKQNRLSNI